MPGVDVGERHIEVTADRGQVDVEMDVEHETGNAVDKVGAWDRAGERVETGWLENPSLLVEGKLGEDGLWS